MRKLLQNSHINKLWPSQGDSKGWPNPASPLARLEPLKLRPHVRAWRAGLTSVVSHRLFLSSVPTCPHQTLTPLRASLASAGAVARWHHPDCSVVVITTK